MSELIRREDAINAVEMFFKDAYIEDSDVHCTDMVYEINHIPAASPWHRVEEPPKQAGEYIVAYHPCYWDDVKTKVTKVGIDNFRGKSAWAKKKFQRVTHWMEKPEPPKEDA